ncbi:uncharacterized protein PHALS_06453 [Plasmopara halstedii]|uniref:Uncharacterized protein n=1 Tax=Plasmopara halstedii TaxID=4781 RepID=A0A0P1B1L8_PLAHL|nr:uncharacterized protein PHALS_06453 [Plasmopara halstedii]CEG48641.1 hypothetical protein PHALS_06453 [Plasmopara halstedii]|eukprot:XP_024585010.1 hypothetical protein PHALS_06453 [Plasmopara halstedii]
MEKDVMSTPSEVLSLLQQPLALSLLLNCVMFVAFRNFSRTVVDRSPANRAGSKEGELLEKHFSFEKDIVVERPSVAGDDDRDEEPAMERQQAGLVTDSPNEKHTPTYIQDMSDRAPPKYSCLSTGTLLLYLVCFLLIAAKTLW